MRHAQLCLQNLAEIPNHWLREAKGCQGRTSRVAAGGSNPGLSPPVGHRPAVGDPRTAGPRRPVPTGERPFSLLHQSHSAHQTEFDGHSTAEKGSGTRTQEIGGQTQ